MTRLRGALRLLEEDRGPTLIVQARHDADERPVLRVCQQADVRLRGAGVLEVAFDLPQVFQEPAPGVRRDGRIGAAVVGLLHVG